MSVAPGAAQEETPQAPRLAFRRTQSHASSRLQDDIQKVKVEPVSPLMSRSGSEEVPSKRRTPTSRLQRVLHTIWRTRQTRDEANVNERAKTTLRELFIYLLFMIVLLILAFSQTSTMHFYFTSALQGAVIKQEFSPLDSRNFLSIKNISDSWRYMEGPMLYALFPEYLYNGDAVPDDDLGHILLESKLLGLPRLRQLVVTSDSCTVPSDFRSTIDECYASYTTGAEYRSALPATATVIADTADAFVYRSESDLQGSSYTGWISTYGGGGFTQLLPQNYSEAQLILANLKENTWLTRGTRVLFVDFTVYNVNINLFSIVRLVMEFPGTGGAVLSSRFLTMQLLTLDTPWERFLTACQVFFVIFVVYYTGEEVMEMSHQKWEYFKHFWSWVDLVILVFSYICIGFSIWQHREVSDTIERLLATSQQYANFETLGYWTMEFYVLVGITVFLTWLKVFRYLSFNKTMQQLSLTLGRCSKDIVGFSVMFFVVFFSYAQLGYLVFGSTVPDFRTFGFSTFTLFRIMLGDFDFSAMQAANRVVGPLFFVSYVVLVFFILFNMFIAIVNDAYSTVKHELKNTQSEFELKTLFSNAWAAALVKLNIRRGLVSDIKRTLQENQEKHEEMKLNDFKGKMAQRHDSSQLENLFTHYDLDGNQVLDEAEQQQMKSDMDKDLNKLEQQEQQLRKGLGLQAEGIARIKGAKASDDIALLRRRMDRLEHSVGAIMSKMDAILLKLEDVEAYTSTLETNDDVDGDIEL
eukprot:m.211336 g.211336  ORF g.211336 m.211336 type:complete len:752 (-) comp22127_c0_seq2:42-2297(-)